MTAPAPKPAVSDSVKEPCGETEASCTCVRVKGHAGAHVCDCAGAWSLENGGFRAVNFPQASGVLGQESAEAWAREHGV